MNQLKIVFMGTATFSEAVLKNLIQRDYNIVQVVSQPDRRNVGLIADDRARQRSRPQIPQSSH